VVSVVVSVVEREPFEPFVVDPGPAIGWFAWPEETNQQMTTSAPAKAR
jgi:hypothetical protein